MGWVQLTSSFKMARSPRWYFFSSSGSMSGSKFVLASSISCAHHRRQAQLTKKLRQNDDQP